MKYFVLADFVGNEARREVPPNIEGKNAMMDQFGPRKI